MCKDLVDKNIGNKKYFLLLSILILLIISLGFLTPVLVENKKKNWDSELNEKIKLINDQTIAIFDKRQKELISILRECANKISKEENYEKIFEIINSREYANYNVILFDKKGDVVAWNKDFMITKYSLHSPPLETFFSQIDLRTVLAVYDTLEFNNRKKKLLLSSDFEKNYFLKDENSLNESFTKKLENAFETGFNIHYNQSEGDSKDGRYSSIGLLNNQGKRIGTAIFSKPTLNSEILTLREVIANLQSVLIFLSLLTLGFSIKDDIKLINSRLIKFLITALFLIIVRLSLFFFSVPAIFMQGELTNPAYFASGFGFGIVQSPLEFFITAFFFLWIATLAFRDLSEYFEIKKKYELPKGRFLFIISIPVLLFFILLVIRGFAASVKSVIFDSTLRYFNEVNIIPAFPHIIMNLAILFTGIGVFLIILISIVSLFLLIINDTSRIKYYYFGILVFTSFPVGYFFIILQAEPLINYLLLAVTLIAIFLVSYRIIFITGKNRLHNYILISVMVSIISVTYLNHFNSELEKGSLKTTALEINRPNDNLLNFLINETLVHAYQLSLVADGLKSESTNFDALAFMIWNQSAMKQETGLSSVSILNKNRKVVGSFSNGIDIKDRVPQFIQVYPAKELKVFDLSDEKVPNKKIFSGVIPIQNNNTVLGFVSATIIHDEFSFFNYKRPITNLFNKNDFNNKTIKTSDLNVFSFLNSTMVASYGKFNPGNNQIDKILYSDFNELNESWINIEFNNENYLVYALKSDTEFGEKITAVCLKDKELEWSLFNFFKLFFLHTLFLIFFSVSILLYRQIRYRDIQYTFRTQLLSAFLILSVLPIISLAVYNRQNVAEKSDNLIKSTLSDKIQLLETHIKRQKQNNPDRTIMVAAEKAAKELDLTFFIYDSTSLLFFSEKDLVNAGLVSSLLNANVHLKMNLRGLNEDYFIMQIDKIKYHAFFKKIKIDNKNYLVSVNDLFYSVINPFSSVDVDVFLFGTYSVAIILIVLLSTILSGKISSPIRRLTKATKSVAHGDLNIQLDENERGEIKELINGFNYMTRELKKNQEELSELERENAWREMAKQVAHEIKNPLTPMKLTIQQLIASFKEGEQNFEKLFEKVSSSLLSQIDSLSQIASEFSRFARMPNPSLTHVDLLPLINEVKYLFSEEHVQIEVETEIDSAVIEADHSHLRRTFINIIRNSIQAGSDLIQFRLTINEFYILTITDNGKGIEESNIDKIFKKDFSTKDTGMGIGLKLAKRFIDSIGGKIFLKETSDKGTSFEIHFPKISLEKNG